MITPENKKYFSLAALAFLFIHFTCTFIYVAPWSWTGERLKIYSGYYMLPLFHQSWSLFAPSPPMINKKVVVKIIDENGNEREEIFMNDFKESHNSVRIGASSRFVMLGGNTLHSVYATWEYLEKNVKDPRQKKIQFSESASGKSFKRLVSQWLRYKNPDWNESYKYQVIVEFTFENYSNYIADGKTKIRKFKIGFKL